MLARTCIPVSLTLTMLLASPQALKSENWPQWRGPRLDGQSLDSGYPTAPAASDIQWRTEVEGQGHASPIVWQDSIFLATANADTQERLLLRMERGTGRLIWRTSVLKSPMEGKHRLNSHASSTPATDGKHIYTAFLDGDQAVLSAHDFKGRLQWQKRLGPFASKHGFCSSPILFENQVIVNADHDGPGYMVSVDGETGREIWRTQRPNQTRSYCVPIIVEAAGRTQMLLSGSKCVASYNPRDGRLIWIMDGPTEQFVASLVHDVTSGLMLMSGGFPEHHLLAIRPDALGVADDSSIAWRTNKGVAYVPSPVCAKGRLFIVSDSGIGHAFEASTGKLIWEERLREHHASLVHAADKIWMINDFGMLRVLSPAPTPRVEAELELGAKVFASPAFSEGQIFVRTENQLLCLGRRQPQADGTRTTPPTSR